MIIASKAFKTRFDLYEDTQALLVTADTNSVTRRLVQDGERDDVGEVMEGLFDYPFAGTFVGFLSQGGTNVKIGILHHCFKLIPAGIPFQPDDHAAFGLLSHG